jgi:hypothetical protein
MASAKLMLWLKPKNFFTNKNHELNLPAAGRTRGNLIAAILNVNYVGGV